MTDHELQIRLIGMGFDKYDNEHVILYRLQAAEAVFTNIESVINELDVTKPLNVKDFMAIGSMIAVYRMHYDQHTK